MPTVGIVGAVGALVVFANLAALTIFGFTAITGLAFALQTERTRSTVAVLFTTSALAVFADLTVRTIHGIPAIDASRGGGVTDLVVGAIFAFATPFLTGFLVADFARTTLAVLCANNATTVVTDFAICARGAVIARRLLANTALTNVADSTSVVLFAALASTAGAELSVGASLGIATLGVLTQAVGTDLPTGTIRVCGAGRQRRR